MTVETATTASGGGPGAATLSVKSVATAVKRRWPTAAAVSLLLGAAAAAAAWYFYPPLYAASAVVVAGLPEQSPLDLQNRNTTPLEIDGFQKTQVALARSREIIREALKKPQVRDTVTIRNAADPVSLIEKRLSVGYQDGTDLLRFSMSDLRPDDLAAILNALKEVYLLEAGKARKEQLKKRTDEITDMITETESRLARLRADLRSFSGGPGPSQLEIATHTALVQDLSRVQTDLRRATGLVLLYRARVSALAEHRVAAAAVVGGVLFYPDRTSPDRLMPDNVALAEAARQDPTVLAFEDLILKKDIALSNYLKQANPKAAKTAETKSKFEEEIADLKKSRDDALAAATSRAAFLNRKQLKDAALHSLTEAEDNVEVLTQREKDLRAELDAKAVPTVRVGDESAQKQLQISQAEVALRGLRDVHEKLIIEALAKPRNLGNWPGGDAETPTAPDKASHYRKIGMWGTAAAFLGVLLVGGIEVFKQRITTREEVFQVAGLRVLGDLPQVTRQGWFGPSAASSAAGFNTALNTLRAVLLLGNKSGSAKVILVTSAVSGEGKTSLAYNLARAVARAHLKTLLVDGDLLRPRLHESFGLPLGPGLGDVIAGICPLASSVVPTDDAGLFFLPAGDRGPTASDTLHGDRAERLFQDFRGGWDLVIIDGPPVLSAAEPLLLGRYADAALVAVRSGVSLAPQVRSACQRLADSNVPVLGAVLNGTPSRSHDYYGDRPPATPGDLFRQLPPATSSETQS